MTSLVDNLSRPSPSVQPHSFIRKLTFNVLFLHSPTPNLENVENIKIIIYQDKNTAKEERIRSIFKQYSNILSLTVEEKSRLKPQKRNNNPFWPSLSELVNLQSLIIYSSCITQCFNEVVSLSNSLSRLKNLLYLKINLDNATHHLKKQQLNQLAHSIAILPQLVSLEVSLVGNKVDTEVLSPLSTAISKLIQLQSLSLKLQQNKLDDFSIIYLMENIQYLKELSFLYLGLENNKISKVGVDMIFQAISSLIHLEYISILLASDKINCSGRYFFNPCDFSQLKIIKRLQFNFNQNSILCPGIEFFFGSLSTFQKIPFLELNLKQVNSIANGFNNFENCLSKLQNVSHLTLNIDKNEINDSMKSLSAGLLQLKQLSSLDLSLGGNNIDDHGIKALSIALSTLTNLSSFSLINSFNNIGQIGMENYSNCFSKLINLESLTLQLLKCEIDDNQIESLSIAISTLRNIKNLTLFLTNNKITNSGVFTLSKAIEKLSDISYLFLEISLNRIDSPGANYLASSIVRLQNLRILKLFFQYGEKIKNNILKQSRSLISYKWIF